MSIKITWLGHSAFTVELDGHTLLFDPFLTGNPLAARTADEIETELILLSHAHGDHLGDTIPIAQRTGARVVCNADMVGWLQKHGAPAVHGQNSGGGADHGWCHVRMTVAHHSSMFPDGSYGGNANGFVVTGRTSGLRLYYAGDTALFSDMKLIGEERIDVAFLPIGDNFTMGPDDAVKAVKLINPRYVVPMHYNTFDLIAVDVVNWANRISAETNAAPVVIDPGGFFSLSE
jgi:L-ascorbate metabolism protein UlaG (beta-lactamase superfamily)